MEEKGRFILPVSYTHLGPVSWGLPWPKDTVRENDSFVLENEEGCQFAVQTRVRAYWPDGSVKWTLHSACPQGKRFWLKPGQAVPEEQLKVMESESCIEIISGRLRVLFTKDGSAVPQIFWNGQCLSLIHICLLGGTVSDYPCVDIFSAADALRSLGRSGQLGTPGAFGGFYRLVSEMVSRPLCLPGRCITKSPDTLHNQEESYNGLSSGLKRFCIQE